MKWDTKEEKGKSMNHVLYVLWYAKGLKRRQTVQCGLLSS